MKKQLFVIAQAKGGSGKSVLVWAMAQKNKDAIYLDMDDGTSTTMKQLRYLKPKMVTFQNSAKTIDRGKFNDFLEYIAVHEKSVFVGDMGASLSEQLPHYFHDYGAGILARALEELNIELTVICVVGGQNIFAACMEYLGSLADACRGMVNIRVAINDHFPFSSVQQEEFDVFANEMKLNDCFHFDLSKDRNMTTQQKLADVLKNGNGLQAEGIMTRSLLFESIKNLAAWKTID